MFLCGHMSAWHVKLQLRERGFKGGLAGTVLRKVNAATTKGSQIVADKVQKQLGGATRGYGHYGSVRD